MMEGLWKEVQRIRGGERVEEKVLLVLEEEEQNEKGVVVPKRKSSDSTSGKEGTTILNKVPTAESGPDCPAFSLRL